MRYLALALLFLAGCSTAEITSTATCAAAVAECAATFRERPPGRAFVPARESAAALAITLSPCSWALLAPSASSTPALVPPTWIRLGDAGLCQVDP